MAATIISIANQKGGVGKTTTAVNLSTCLAAAGRKVLLIDLDPQANATSGLGFEKKENQSIYSALLGEGDLDDRIQETRYKNLSIVTGEVDLCGVEVELAKVDDRLQRLRNTLNRLLPKTDYDLVVIDCPPSLGILTLNAFGASDYLLVPIQCEYYALEGISMIIRLLNQIKESGTNPDLKLIGVLMTMFDGRTNLSHQVVEEVRTHFGQVVFETVIPRATRLAEAPSFGQAISEYDPCSVGTAAYEVLALEVMERLESHDGKSAER